MKEKNLFGRRDYTWLLPPLSFPTTSLEELFNFEEPFLKHLGSIGNEPCVVKNLIKLLVDTRSYRGTYECSLWSFLFRNTWGGHPLLWIPIFSSLNFPGWVLHHRWCLTQMKSHNINQRSQFWISHRKRVFSHITLWRIYLEFLIKPIGLYC